MNACCAFFYYSEVWLSVVPQTRLGPNAGTHQCVSSQCCLSVPPPPRTHAARQNNDSLCTAGSPRPAHKNKNIVTKGTKCILGTFFSFFSPFNLRGIKFHSVSMRTALMPLAMITELVKRKDFVPFWSQAKVLWFAEITAGFEEEGRI